REPRELAPLAARSRRWHWGARRISRAAETGEHAWPCPSAPLGALGQALKPALTWRNPCELCKPWRVETAGFAGVFAVSEVPPFLRDQEVGGSNPLAPIPLNPFSRTQFSVPVPCGMERPGKARKR